MQRTGLPESIVVLPADVVFRAKPNWGRARTYVLPSGEYRYHGKDRHGYFLKHQGGGFRYDSRGPIAGGFFVPSDPTKSWGLWTSGASVDQAMAVLGAAGAGVGSSDPDSEAIYIVDLPDDTKRMLEVYVGSQR